MSGRSGKRSGKGVWERESGKEANVQKNIWVLGNPCRFYGFWPGGCRRAKMPSKRLCNPHVGGDHITFLIGNVPNRNVTFHGGLEAVISM